MNRLFQMKNGKISRQPTYSVCVQCRLYDRMYIYTINADSSRHRTLTRDFMTDNRDVKTLKVNLPTRMKKNVYCIMQLYMPPKALTLWKKNHNSLFK